MGFLEQQKRDVLLIVLCALMSLIFSIFFINKHPIIGWDSVCYIDVAKNVAGGRGFVLNLATFDSKTLISPLSEWMPLYPFFIAIFIKAGIDFTFAARLLPLIFLYLIPFSAYFLARYLFGNKVALFSAIFVSFSLPLIIASSYAMTETIFIFFVILFILFLSKIIEADVRYYNLFIAGVFGGLAYLTRANGILLVPLAFFCIFFICSNTKYNNLKKFSVLILGFVVSSGIWLARNYTVFGSPFYYGQFGLSIPSLNSFWEVLKTTFWDNLPLIVFLPFIIYYMKREIERKKVLLLLSFPTILLLFFTVYSVQETRLLSPAYPFLIMASTKGLFDLSEKIKEKYAKNYLVQASVIVIIVQLLFIINYYSNEEPVTETGEWADWIKLNTNPDDVVLTNCLSCVRYDTWRYAVSTAGYTLHKDDVKFIGLLSLNISKLENSVNYYKEIYAIYKQGPVNLNESSLSKAVKNLNARYIVLFKDDIISKEQSGEFLYNLKEGVYVPHDLKIVYNEKNVVIYKINL